MEFVFFDVCITWKTRGTQIRTLVCLALHFKPCSLPSSVSCPEDWVPGWCGWTPWRVCHGAPWQSLSGPSTSLRLNHHTERQKHTQGKKPHSTDVTDYRQVSHDYRQKSPVSYLCRGYRQSDCWEWSSFWRDRNKVGINALKHPVSSWDIFHR